MREKIFVFERNKFTLEEVNEFNVSQCEYMARNNECECFENVNEFLWHLNNNCFPQVEKLFFKREFVYP